LLENPVSKISFLGLPRTVSRTTIPDSPATQGEETAMPRIFGSG
jgi:hypothetical protein